MSLEYNLSFFLLLVVGGRHDKEGESSVLFICLLGNGCQVQSLIFIPFFFQFFVVRSGEGGGDDDNVGIISCIVGKVKMY